MRWGAFLILINLNIFISDKNRNHLLCSQRIKYVILLQVYELLVLRQMLHIMQCILHELSVNI